jgi:hypothetical protein
MILIVIVDKRKYGAFLLRFFFNQGLLQLVAVPCDNRSFEKIFWETLRASSRSFEISLRCRI